MSRALYVSLVTGNDDLDKRITDAIMTVHANILLTTQISHLEYYRTWQKLVYRPDVVLPRVPTLWRTG